MVKEQINKLQNMRNSENVCHIAVGTNWLFLKLPLLMEK